ncbi:hypothetical protein V3481_017872 [Fusarium oxysporum f. sp. vasinfectum]
MFTRNDTSHRPAWYWKVSSRLSHRRPYVPQSPPSSNAYKRMIKWHHRQHYQRFQDITNTMTTNLIDRSIDIKDIILVGYSLNTETENCMIHFPACSTVPLICAKLLLAK